MIFVTFVNFAKILCKSAWSNVAPAYDILPVNNQNGIQYLNFDK